MLPTWPMRIAGMGSARRMPRPRCLPRAERAGRLVQIPVRSARAQIVPVPHHLPLAPVLPAPGTEEGVRAHNVAVVVAVREVVPGQAAAAEVRALREAWPALVELLRADGP